MSIQNFALIDGKIAFIENYLHLRGNYKDRPTAICPVNNCGCEMVLVLPLSDDRQPHFRHKSNSIGEHSTESLWHYGVKFHLADQLQKGAKIQFDWKCKSDSCRRNHQLPPLLKKSPNYIDIDKKKLGKFLPDITLYDDNQPLAAIEIENTHESSDEKINFYDSSKLPWFELSVQSQNDYQKILKWSGGNGLQKFLKRHYYPESLATYCPTCDMKNKEKLKRIEKRKEQEKLREETRRKQRIKAEKYKNEVGERLFKYLLKARSIPLNFELSCHRCFTSFAQSKSFGDLGSFEINHHIQRNSDLVCDIAIINSYYENCLLVLLKEEHSSNEDLKESISREQGSAVAPYVEIEVLIDKSTFKVVDSSYQRRLHKKYTCERCLSEIEEAKKLRIVKEDQEKELRIEEAKRKHQNAIKDYKQKIASYYEVIRLTRCKKEKEQAREKIQLLKYRLQLLE